MKLVSVFEGAHEFSKVLRDSQHQPVLVQSRGKAMAVIIGVEGHRVDEILLGGALAIVAVIKEKWGGK